MSKLQSQSLPDKTMKLKRLIEILSNFDPDMDLDGMTITSKGVRPYLQESSIFIGASAFWGAVIGVIALGAMLAFLNTL